MPHRKERDMRDGVANPITKPGLGQCLSAQHTVARGARVACACPSAWRRKNPSPNRLQHALLNSCASGALPPNILPQYSHTEAAHSLASCCPPPQGSGTMRVVRCTRLWLVGKSIGLRHRIEGLRHDIREANGVQRQRHQGPGNTSA